MSPRSANVTPQTRVKFSAATKGHIRPWLDLDNLFKQRARPNPVNDDQVDLTPVLASRSKASKAKRSHEAKLRSQTLPNAVTEQVSDDVVVRKAKLPCHNFP